MFKLSGQPIKETDLIVHKSNHLLILLNAKKEYIKFLTPDELGYLRLLQSEQRITLKNN
jgi:hypothetical protein